MTFRMAFGNYNATPSEVTEADEDAAVEATYGPAQVTLNKIKGEINSLGGILTVLKQLKDDILIERRTYAEPMADESVA